MPPIYEYRCTACGHHLEVLQKMTEGPLRKCPDCGKSQLRRLVSAPQFRLKGSGWYETDFKNNNETKRNLVEKAESSDSGAEKSTNSTAKEEAGKAVAEAKKDGAEQRPKESKPPSAKPTTTPRRKTNLKSRARTGRR